MKKITGMLITAAIVLSLCACASDGGDGDAAPPTGSAQNSQEQPEDANDTYTLISDRGTLSGQGAMDAVRDFLAGDDALCFTIEGTDELAADNGAGADSGKHMAYLVHAYTDEDDHISTVGRYAVGIFDDMLWEYDVLSDEYRFVPGGLPSVDWSDGFRNGALGVVVRNPDEYYKWALDPVLRCDASGGDPYAETILVCPMYEGTKVVLRTGTLSMDASGDNWEFAGEEFTSFSLGGGEYAIIRCTVPEGIPAFEVEFLTASGKGTYIVGYDGTGDINKPEYVFADEG